jgi:hypothetical protein
MRQGEVNGMERMGRRVSVSRVRWARELMDRGR